MKRLIVAVVAILMTSQSFALTQTEADTVLAHRFGLVLEQVGKLHGKVKVVDSTTGKKVRMDFEDFQKMLHLSVSSLEERERVVLVKKIAKYGLITLGSLLGATAVMFTPSWIAAAFSVPGMFSLAGAGLLDTETRNKEQMVALMAAYKAELEKEVFGRYMDYSKSLLLTNCAFAVKGYPTAWASECFIDNLGSYELREKARDSKELSQSLRNLVLAFRAASKEVREKL